MNRREFLNLGMMTAATATLAGCGRASESALVSEVMRPEFYLSGVAQWYATTCTECSSACGLGARVIGGRLKKVEGLPSHPYSHGGHCVKSETALQAVYNPDRIGAPLKKGGNGLEPQKDWDEAQKALTSLVGGDAKGKALWITGPLRGTLGAVIAEAASKMGARIWVLDFPGTASQRAALKALGQQPRLPYHDIAKADYLVNFGADFLGAADGSTDAGWAYGQFRRSSERLARGVMVSFSSRMSLTVGNSDRWVPVKPGSEGYIAAAVGNIVCPAAMPAFAKGITAKEAAEKAGIEEALIERLAARLKKAENPVVVGGYDNAAYSNGHWALAVINALHRGVSKANHETFETDLLTAGKGLTPAKAAGLMITAKQAVDGLQAGDFSHVLVAGPNPAYQLPAKMKIGEALAKATTIVFSNYVNETAVGATWVLPTTTFLESWGDVSVDGPKPIYGIQQPVVAPRPGSMALGDLLLLAMDKKPAENMHDLVAGHFKGEELDKVLAVGGIYEASEDGDPYSTPAIYPPVPAEKSKPKAARPAGVSPWTKIKGAAPKAAEAELKGEGEYTLLPYPSASRFDGSLTNRPWVPELPDPMSQAVWTSWVEVNPRVAKEMGLKRGDVVKLDGPAGSIEVPVLVSPTVHPELLAIPMGFGHKSMGRYAYDKGTNPMDIVSPEFQEGTDEIVYASTKVKMTKTGKNINVVTYDHRYTDDKFYKDHGYVERELPE